MSMYNPETNRTEGEENCYACGHRVWVESDEDGTPVVYRPIEVDAATLTEALFDFSAVRDTSEGTESLVAMALERALP